MRDTGPVAKQLTGDTEAAAPYMGIARTQLGILKNQMAFAGQTTGARQIALPDGTTIRVAVNGGIPRIQIDTPATSSEEQPLEVPQEEFTPEFPQPPLPPGQWRVEAVEIFLNHSSANLYPFVLGGKIIQAPPQPGAVLPIGPKVKYEFADSGHAVLLGIAVVDVPTGALDGYQPPITAKCDNGTEIPAASPSRITPPVLLTKAYLDAVGASFEPNSAIAFGVNPAWVDTVVKFSANAQDGTDAGNELIVAGGAVLLCAVIAFAGQPVIINGTTGTTGEFIPCPSMPVTIDIPVTGVAVGYGGGLEFSTATPSLRPGPSGSYDNGAIYNCTWVQTSGDITSSLTGGNIAAVITFEATGSGTHTMGGILTMDDGYGNLFAAPVNLTITIP